MPDALEVGRGFRRQTVVDEFSRECLADAVDTSIGVARALDRIAELCGYPCPVVSDNPKERTANSMLKWQEDCKVEEHAVGRGEPMQNCISESFNGRMREQRLLYSGPVYPLLLIPMAIRNADFAAAEQRSSLALA